MIDWEASRVLVTGGAGFLGSFVVERSLAIVSGNSVAMFSCTPVTPRRLIR